MSKKWYSYFVTVEDGSEASAAPPPPDAAQAIADIAASVAPPPTFQKPVADPAALDQIYAAAEIPVPAHGFTIFKVADMLRSEHIRNLPVEIKKSSVLLALDAAGVKIQDVIQDAIRRDRALDAFEVVQQRAMEQLEARKTDENKKLQDEADRVLNELRARIQANNDEITKEHERFRTWRLQKQQEEQRIAETVAPFVPDNPISTGAAAAAPPAPKPPEAR